MSCSVCTSVTQYKEHCPRSGYSFDKSLPPKILRFLSSLFILSTVNPVSSKFNKNSLKKIGEDYIRKMKENMKGDLGRNFGDLGGIWGGNCLEFPNNSLIILY